MNPKAPVQDHRDRDRADLPCQGFTVTVRSASWLVIDDTVGCSVQVLAGRAWITVDGAPGDVIAETGATVQLEAGVRSNVSAFQDVASVLVAAPNHRSDVAFNLRRRNGVHWLSVTAEGDRRIASFESLSAAFAAFAGRLFAPGRTVNI